MPETYYERLGVSPDATTAEIRDAYRDRLKDAHPDVSDDPDAGSRTRRLIEAKEVLTDDVERERYDRLGHSRYVNGTDAVDDHEATANDESTARSGTADAAGGGPAGTSQGGVHGTTGRRAQRDAARQRGDRAERRRQNRETRAGWNTAGRSGKTVGNGGTDRGWRAWDTSAPYRVHAEDQTTFGSRLFPPEQSLLLLAVGFAIYPLLLWGTLEPRFPLFVNLVLGACLVLLVVFLVGMPAVGVTVFGAWLVLLPVVLTVGLGVPLTAPAVLVSVGGTALPLGLALLIFLALRG